MNQSQLQSLISRNSARITLLEKFVHGMLHSDGYREYKFPSYKATMAKHKKEIAALAGLQRVLKMELRDLVEWKWVEDCGITLRFVGQSPPLVATVSEQRS